MLASNSIMLYQNMVVNERRKSKQEIPESVDSCTKLLEWEVANKRKRRNSRLVDNDEQYDSLEDLEVKRGSRDNTQKWNTVVRKHSIWEKIQIFLMSF